MVQSINLPWPAYGLDWSEGLGSKIAISSFTPSKHNQISIYSVKDNLETEPTPSASLSVDFVSTRVKWVPRGEWKGCEYLATSGLGVTLFRKDGAGLYSVANKLIASAGALRRGSVPAGTTGPSQNRNPPAPVTSFDWNRIDPSLLVTASYDTTCTVWNLETGSIKTQLIAHDKEVFDVSYAATSPDIFVSVGADGSLRMFDTRNLDHSTILYESRDASPLVRVGMNRHDSNFVFCFGLDATQVPIIDVRSPAVPVLTLDGHVSVNAAQWAPHSAAHLMIADQSGLLIWDLKENSGSGSTPQWTLGMEAGTAPVHFVWPTSATNSVAYTTNTQLCLTKI